MTEDAEMVWVGGLHTDCDSMHKTEDCPYTPDNMRQVERHKVESHRDECQQPSCFGDESTADAVRQQSGKCSFCGESVDMRTFSDHAQECDALAGLREEVDG